MQVDEQDVRDYFARRFLHLLHARTTFFRDLWIDELNGALFLIRATGLVSNGTEEQLWRMKRTLRRSFSKKHQREGQK